MDLSEVLDFSRIVYAHTGSKVCPGKETLQDHTRLCHEYFCCLLEKGNMKDSFYGMEPVLTGGLDGAYADWFWQALYDVIVFHDAGKINPGFQKDVMKNECFSNVDIRGVHDRNHSALSAYMYLDCHIAQLEQIDRRIPIELCRKICLYELVCMNAYLIMKHHSGLGCFDEFIRAVSAGGRLYNIDIQIQHGYYAQLYRGKYSHMSVANYAGILKRANDGKEDRNFAKYIYMRLVFSLITASDYYATNEYMTGTKVTNFDSASELLDFKRVFENVDRVLSIKAFCPDTVIDDGRDINYLRNMLFHETAKNIEAYADADIFYLEAPTGCGKSIAGFNCSFMLTGHGMGKIFYVYPFNNLVEQNEAFLRDLFEGYDVFEKAAVVNSITPIKRVLSLDGSDDSEYGWCECDWCRSLLDRQFLNYPVVLTTHVSLFDTMFGSDRESIFGFHQLVGSVIVLDEIQSYKNSIWTEIMMLLQYYCKYMHCKVIIMSATLPDMSVLTGKHDGVVHLVRNSALYFDDARFRNRVDISYELLDDQDFDEDMLYEHVKSHVRAGIKILVEFIQKEMAYRFFDRLVSDTDVGAVVDRMTGDDNSVDRAAILERIKTGGFEYCGYILVATQVIEAGVDIDMDVGYKDISTLDSEEQFMGRINRNYRGKGIVYYFDLCPAQRIYGKDDYRISDMFTLRDVRMRSILENKCFSDYYLQVMDVIKKNRNESSDSIGKDAFVQDVGSLDFQKISKRMCLISDDRWTISVFLARSIVLSDGAVIDGMELWNAYKMMLTHPPDDYAEFRVRLSDIKSRLNLFIYQIKKSVDIVYSDRIGELYLIENGDDFFLDGRLDKQKLEWEGSLFV